MPGNRVGNFNFRFHPLTPERWEDFEKLFGPRGACGGCWCMWFRLTHKEFDALKGDGNRRAMKNIVDSGRVPGILAYVEGEPVGWCSVAPREHYPRLERGKVTAPVDDQPVWSIVCFFIAKGWRRKGVNGALLHAAVDYVRDSGGSIVEGYAIEPKKKAYPDLYGFHGLASVYKKVGFIEVARRTPTRPVMRYIITA